MDKLYARIFADPEFQALQRRRGRFVWTLSGTIFLSFYLYIFIIAFRPEWLAVRLGPHTVINWGVMVGVGLILLGFILTGLYVIRANGFYDPAARAIVDRLSAED
jgi:uncharacterized membrane protein (DUF485 family)